MAISCAVLMSLSKRNGECCLHLFNVSKSSASRVS